MCNCTRPESRLCMVDLSLCVCVCVCVCIACVPEQKLHHHTHAQPKVFRLMINESDPVSLRLHNGSTACCQTGVGCRFSRCTQSPQMQTCTLTQVHYSSTNSQL